jgi:hypothetical protein
MTPQLAFSVSLVAVSILILVVLVVLVRRLP